MANAEQLLNEAQYAFQSISYGESRDNMRNASRAKSLCTKIIRKFPTSSYAAEAHAILRRLGEEAYTSHLRVVHQHTTQAEHHTAPTAIPKPKPVPLATSSHRDETVLLDWTGLLAVLAATSKSILAVIAFLGLVLFGIFGPILLLPLIAFVLLTGPFRQLLKPQQRKSMNVFIAQANAFIEDRRRSRTGLN
jgi:hypothetical protein